MIPKVIHYCWFGGKPLPALAKKCILSWQKYFPDYEIKVWNETNFDVNCIPYTKAAYAAKKYAFVSDYARLKILYEEGGIYFDTDVEVIKSMDDIIAHGSFFGCEPDGINPGLGCGAIPGLAIYKKILDFYASLSFYRENGSFNQTTIVAHVTNLFNDLGYKMTNEVQSYAGIFIYPSDFFCPLNYKTHELKITENTRSIHHYSATWITFKQRIFKHIECLMGRKCAKLLSNILRKTSLLK